MALESNELQFQLMWIFFIRCFFPRVAMPLYLFLGFYCVASFLHFHRVISFRNNIDFSTCAIFSPFFPSTCTILNELLRWMAKTKVKMKNTLMTQIASRRMNCVKKTNHTDRTRLIFPFGTTTTTTTNKQRQTKDSFCHWLKTIFN